MTEWEEPDIRWGNIKPPEERPEEPKVYNVKELGGKTYGTASIRQIALIRKQLPPGYKINLIRFNREIQQIQQAQSTYNQVYNEQIGENGLPINWDYHGELGPWGQKLPDGALGWDPYGRPDFGPGPIGWIKREWNEIVGNYNIPEEELTAMKPIENEEFDRYQKGLWRDGKIGDWAKAWFGRAASEIRYGWSKLEYSENDPTVLSVGSRFVGSAFTGVGDAFDVLAGSIEWALSPTMLTGDDYIREGKTAITEDMYNIINKIPVVRELSKSLIGQFAAILDPKYQENIRQYRDLQIWRMGYSASMDVMARAEFLRRMEQGGEDPRLLAMELQDPAEELVGRLWLDPLNIPAIAGIPGALARGAKSKILGIAPEAARMTDAVSVMSPVMDFIRDAGRLTDEFGDASKVASVAEKVRDGFVAVRNGINDLAQRRSLRALTAQGKRSAMLTGSGHFIKVMAEHFSGNTNEFLEYLYSLVKMSSDDIGEVTEGLIQLGKLIEDPKMFEMALSQAGTETSVILRNLMLDAEGKLKDATKMFGSMEDAADMVEFTNKLYSRMVGATTDIFPTVTKQIKLNDELAELISKHGADATQVTDFIKKNPFSEVKIPQWMRTVDAAHQLVQPVYDLFARAQGVLYMGLSPAYWMRNKFTNFAQIFVDQGGTAAFKSLFFSKVHAEDAIKSYLGFVPKIEGFGGAASWAGKAPGDGVLKFFSGKAAQDEARAAAHVMAESIRDTMSKGLLEGRIIPSTIGLESFTNEMRVGIVRLAQQHNGDVDAVWKALREAKKAGGYDVARNLAFLSVEDINDLQKLSFGLHNRITQEVLQAETLDDAIKALDDIAEDWAKQGSKHWNESRRLADMNEIYAEIDMAMEGMTPAQREFVKDIVTHQQLANNIAAEMTDKAVDSARLDAMGILTKELGDHTKARKIIDQITDPINAQIKELRSAARVEQAQLLATHKALTKRLQNVGRMRDIEARAKALRGIWKEYDFGKLVDMPEELTGQFMRDNLWEVIHPTKRGDIWNNYRNSHYALRKEEAFTLLSPITPEGAETLAARVENYFTKANLDMKRAIALDDLVQKDGQLFIKATIEMQQQFYRKRLEDLAKAGKEGTDEFIEVQKNLQAIDEYLAPAAKEGEAVVAEELMAGPESPLARKLREAEAAEGKRIMESAGEYVPLSVDDVRKRISEYAGPEEIEGELSRIGLTTEEAILAEQRRIAEQFVEEPVRDLYWQTIREGKRPVSSNAYGPGDKGIWWEDPVTGEKGFNALEITEIEEIKYIPVDEYMGTVPLGVGDDLASPVINMSESTGKMQEMIDKIKAGLNENWGQIRDYTFDPRQERQLNEWMNTMRERVTVARAEALDIAQNLRDFILHNYQSRRGIDQLLSYIYPYQFWHSRTYAKWMQRLVTEPEWVARYARYRQYLEKKHAGLPDWWKYQLNTNELLGFDSEHPLWFNLEATLNPLYGMTGVDFTSPERRLDWWSATMEDLNKVGPSIWTPYQLAAALIYHAQGKEEASSKWAGRMFTGTRFIRDVTAMMGMQEGKGYEIDPFVNYFSGGLGPWERARVGRVLGEMQKEGKYTPAEIIDAAYQQKGAIWDEAMARSINDRALGQSVAFLFGAGFKPRSETDQQIDRMYNEIYGLMSKRDFLSDEEYRQGWDDLERRYPFMDAVLMSKKGGLERDEALAWNVLSRIPPGATDEMAERVGINEEDITSFYDYKGDLLVMPEQKRLRFQAAILDLAALLDLPNAATRAEWDRARATYRDMQEIGQSLYGEDIWDRVDTFYATDDKDAFLRRNPIVEQALDWQQETIIMTPILAAYYTSIKRIEQYLKGQMYDEAERLYGADLWDVFEVYHRLKDIDSDAARKHWDDNPKMESYLDFRDERLVYIAERLEQLGSRIPDALPAEFRIEMPIEEYTPSESKEAWYESQVLSYLSGVTPPAGIPPATQDILAYLEQNEKPLYYLYMSYLQGEELPIIAKEKLSELGIVVQ